MSWRKLAVLSSGLVMSAVLAGCGGGSKPISVAVSASPTTVDPTNTSSLTATVTNDKKAAGVTWSVTGGGALSGTTTSSATYTAPSPASSALTVTVTATSVADATKTGTVTITVPAGPSVATSALTAGTVGTAYSATMAGSGGIPPYTWSITNGTLPAGLTMTAAGVISGTPTATGAGTANLTFKMTDSGSPNPLSATATLGLTVNAAPAVTFTTASSLTAGTYNAAYSATVAATGGAGALTYSITSGALPTGLTMSAAGVISGTPTVVGSFSITVKAADAFGDSATKVLALTVSYPPLTVTTTTLPTGYVGSVYTATTLAATGGSGTGYTWTLQTGSSLPAGLAMSTAGVLAGTPTATGPASFTVVVTDSASNTGSLAMSIVVKPAVSITTALALPTGYVGSAYSQTLAATGGSGTGYTWAISSGSTAPAGLTLSAAGVLSGTPTTTGTPSFDVTVTDSANNKASATFSMTISPGISITTATTLPYAYQGTAYAPITLAATGGSGAPYTWTWAAAGGSSLPAGLSLSTAGVISGTPTASGTFTIAITAKDGASNTRTVDFSLQVEATLTVTSTTLPSGTINVAYSQSLMASGGSGTGYTWAVTAGTSSLATLDLTVSAAGVVSGTPTTTGTATFTAQVTDSQSHTASQSVSVSVFNALTVVTTTLPATNIGTAYSQTLNAGGGSGSGYTWTTTSSNLSTYGLALSSGGVVSGTPTTAGTASFTAKVTDSASNTAAQALTITIYNALSLPAPNPSSLPAGTTGGVYNGTVSATGGSGGYTWTITGFPQDGLNASATGATVNITGTPTAAATVSFTAAVKDNATDLTVGPNTYTIAVTNPAALTLPAANPSSLPSATVNTSYSGTIVASGGAGPYSWKVNTQSVPTNGSALALTNGLSVTNDGSKTLTVTGTPTSTGTVTIAAQVTDNLSTTAGPTTYTVAVNAAGSQVSGNINLANTCGSATLPTVTVSINTSPVQTTTTDSSGNYTFASIPNGTYTITPSITGPTSVFSPASITGVVVNNSSVSGKNFTASLGYTVSGTVSYAGSQTGQVYVMLSSNNCSGDPLGTSLTSPGSYTIRGVPPGTYTLSASIDALGETAANSSDPSGSTSPVSVGNANVTGANVSLADPAAYTLSAGPGFKVIAPTDQGVVVNYKPIMSSGSPSIEMPTSYTVQWSTSSSFTSTASATFKANGRGTDLWIINNSQAGLSGAFSNGTAYYFRARGNVGGTAGPWSVYGGGTPKSITIGAPSSGSTISGTVTFTGTATGPLYVGFYDQNTGNIYSQRIAAPTSPQAFSVMVPNGTNYFFFGIIDQNNDGIIGPGDVSNTDSNGAATVISGSAVMNLTLPAGNSTAAIITQHYQQTTSGGTNSGFNLNFDIREANKAPVAVTLTAGPNVITPIDIGKCSDCGHDQYQYFVGIGATPAVGDSYSFKITYSDGTSDTVTAQVTAVLNAFATNLSPSATSSTSLQPTFTWTDPANASNYVYQFYLSDNSGNSIWNVPGNNSNLNGLPSTVTSLAWGVDPNDNTNTPTVNSLTSGVTYNWQITVQDSNGNQAQTEVYYIP